MTMTGAGAGAQVMVPFKTRCPPPVGLARPRLEAALAGPDAPGTVLLVAPPGAGKTTLLGRVAAASGPGAAWFTAGVEDHAEPVLVRYLARALLGAEEARLPADAGMDDLLVYLGDETARGVRTLLVVDDLHEITGTAAEAALARFLLQRPSSIRVLLGARRPTSFNTARMLASEDLLELGGEDLRFRSWEVEDLFRTVHLEPLAPEAAALLCRRVGGLAAALQLFHLSVRGLTHLEREAEIVRLNGRSRLIRSYLARTVLDGLSQERRRFLLRTAPLGVLEGSLCDALLEQTGSSQVLRELEAQQLFTTSRDEGLTYRYHQVLRDHLEVTLEDELAGAEVIALHARAGGLLERAGHHTEAVRAYTRAGDWGAVARLVRERAGLADPDAGEPISGALALAEQNDPWLAVARARQLLRRGSTEAGLVALRLVEAATTDPDLAANCAQERLQAAVWRAHRAPSTEVVRDPLGAIRSLTRTLAPPVLVEVEGWDRAQDPAWGVVRTVGHLLAGRLPEAQLELDRTYPLLQGRSWPQLAAGMLGVLLEMATPSRHEHCCAALEDLSLTADVEGYPWLARVAHGLQACLVLESAGQTWRIDACRSAIAACRADGDEWGGLILGFLTSVSLARQGEYAEARDHLGRAARTVDALGSPVLEVWVRGLALALSAADDRVATERPDRGLTLLARHVALDDLDVVLAACWAAVRPTGVPAPTAGPAGGRSTVEPDSWVHCLGGFQLGHGTEIDLSPLRPRARLVLMLLALEHGADVHRERLIDSLWPDARFEAGTHRLQVAVSSVRRLLEDHGMPPTSLRRHGDAYRLELRGATVDVQRLERGIAALEQASRAEGPVLIADRAREAMHLYGGDLLPEVGAAEWVIDERERLRLATASSLAEAARVCLEKDRADLALSAARRVVQLDPLRDSAWLLLARIQRQLGDYSAAQVTLAQHGRVLDLVDVPSGPPAKERLGQALALLDHLHPPQHVGRGDRRDDSLDPVRVQGHAPADPHGDRGHRVTGQGGVRVGGPG